MERYEKLKLLRGLYCLTQEEMAALANNSHRSIYSTAEIKTADTAEKKSSGRKLTLDQASGLEEALRFSKIWFNDDTRAPLQDYRFVYVDMDWSQRHLSVTGNVRQRRINDAERSVMSYLPKMLAENEPVQCSVGRTDNGRQLVFFLFDYQGLLLRTVPGQPITRIINDIVQAVDSQPSQIALTDSEFEEISASSVYAVHEFLTRCNVTAGYWQLAEPEIVLSSKNRFDYKNVFGETVRKATLKNICQEIIAHGLTIDEVARALHDFQQHPENNKKTPGARPGV